MSTVFICGGATNTGLTIAKKFASMGYNTALSSRDEEKAFAAAESISKTYNVKSVGYKLDISDVKNTESVFAKIKKDFGGIDALIANSAHLGVDMGIENSDEAAFDSVIDVNIKGTFFVCREAALMMKENKKGSIVIISSVHSKRCIQGRCLYSLSKGALNTLSTSMAIELAKYNIRSNVILAGAIRTDRWIGLTDEQKAKRRENWPLGIESTGEDIANAAYFLSSDLAKTITGAELTVDSGILTSLLKYHE